jgi:hypothetical protein
VVEPFLGAQAAEAAWDAAHEGLPARWRVGPDEWRFKEGGCGPVKEVTARLFIGWTFVYDESTDTLFGPFEDGPTTWHRV